MSRKRSQVNGIIKTEYSEIMKKSYIDYAMSVIVSRALPDVRDGLKPVQRRTLYAMHELGLKYDRPYRKSARVVGDTMGKYHPHGDTSIYDALVVMSQDFKKGMVLADGHGNFGSIEGDGAAAMRYTETRLTQYTQEVYLADLDKKIVDYRPNFDETEKEPVVLPVRVPNLLVNGAEGIAVGMATSIPPHNLGDVIKTIVAYIKNNETSTSALLRLLKGPDFPTGGSIVNKNDLLSIYETGHGKIKVRGKIEIEELKGGKKLLVISEIPYTMIGNGIGKFLNDVYNLVESKVTTDVIDISNQSSNDGIRIVLELRKGADVEHLKNMLYKKTRLEDTFGVNMLTVADGRPQVLGLKAIVEHFVDFQFELTTRKYQTLLQAEEERKEVQEGLIKAVDIIDLIIEILRGSQNVKEVKACLVTGETGEIKFKSQISKKMASLLRFTERQATAILDMRLHRLIGLEITALQLEHEKTLENILRYRDILENFDSMSNLIIDELEEYRTKFARKRRTIIENAEEVFFEEKPIEEQDVVFLMDKFGYGKIIELNLYERNKEVADEENTIILDCKNISRLCLFTNTGRMHQVKVLDLPLAKLREKGIPLDNVSNYDSAVEEIVMICDSRQLELGRFIFATKKAMIKTVSGEEFQVGKRTIAATKLLVDDEVIGVVIASNDNTTVLQTEKGYFLRFPTRDIPEKKKMAVGVRGMKLTKDDQLWKLHQIGEGVEVKVPSGDKSISINRLKLAKRDGVGSKP
jgi:DNA gyrase subunit A